MRRLVLVVACTGCSSVLGIEELAGPGDGGAQGDRPVDVIVGPRIRITGTARQISPQMGNNLPIANAQVALVTEGSDNRATVQTSADGTFSMDVDTSGQPIDGYLRMVDLSGAVLASDTLFVEPLTRDVDVVLQGFDQPTLDMLASVCTAPAGMVLPLYVIFALGVGDTPLAGVTIKSIPNGVTCVDDAIPRPGDVTGPSGIGFVFGIPPGPATVMAGAGSRSVVAEPATTMFVPIRASGP